ncbi:hypothetical protein RN001_008767 [Aquatica leii]|uniref:Farnesol dehydrogenase n=1 Tax=Aquatica leii TaxID=1421715 RepID=A0AAN7S9U9_9COLE|nr:hypothetical protein RN001_008767 [Aquatica leii]
MNKWKGKVAVVTGASAGIGAAIADALVKEGMIVIGIARRKHIIEDNATRLRAEYEGILHALEADITNEDDILKVFNWTMHNYGPVHVLINNAGISRLTTLCDGDTKMWKDIINTNVMGLCIATREAIKNMQKHQVNGHVICISSIAGHFDSNMPYHIYSASKKAVTAVTETVRLELLSMNSRIKITTISPGHVYTEILKATNLASGGLISKEAEEQFRLQNPALQAEDIADAVLYALKTPPYVQSVAMDRWRNKVAVVTGASSGIGAAIAEKLVKEEVIVVGLARGQEKLEEISKKLNHNKTYFYPRVADITKEEDILNAFNWAVTNLGPIHILVNNAGIVRFANLAEGSTDLWKQVFDTNVIGLCIATREAVKNMKDNNVDGHIVHINSVAGHKIPLGTQIYGASKYAVTALTEILRQELVSQGSKIKVSSISPGYVKTNIFQSALSNTETPSVSTNTDLLTSIDAVLQPEDVAESVLYTLGTPPHVQVHELIIKPVGEAF